MEYKQNPMSHSGFSKGLTAEEVAASRKKHGANIISIKKQRGFMSHLLENFGDPMVRILLTALGINLLFLFRNSDWYETVGIAVAVLLAVFISTLSERGSESAFQKLQEESSRVSCRVIRRDGICELSIDKIVVGDLVDLQPGDRIPADGHLIEGSVDIDQSALNGETKEAKKYPSANKDKEMGSDLLNPSHLFSSTVVCAGRGVMRVAAIGDKTFYGKLAEEIQEEKGESPLKVKLTGLAKTISKFGYIGAGLVAFAYLFNVILLDYRFDSTRILAMLADPVFILEKLLHAVTLAVTVIVVAVPEGLPMMITVVLSSNMKRMLKDNVLVRKLVGIETAGSLNILFTDKTGTLTKGRPQVTAFIDANGKAWSKTDRLQEQPLWKTLYKAIKLNSSADLSKGKAIGGNATDRALLEYAESYPIKHMLIRGNVIPFDSASKYMASDVSGETQCTFIKGAPEIILPHCCEFIDTDGSIRPIYSKLPFELKMGELQKDAARLIAIAVSDTPITGGKFGKLRLIGIAAVRDDVRREAVEGVRQIHRAGIQVVMITGDAKITAEAIARRTGLLKDKDSLVLTSKELNMLDDQHVSEILPRLRVVARALPQDKSRLVRIAQNMGLVAGMTGDGVNDAPALKRADVGFAMGSGTEVAKEAGDIIILDDNLLSIAKAVRYGRTIFKSIRKFIIFQLTLNFCAMGVSIIAPIIGVDAPITVIQMLWINIVMDTLAGLAFGGEQALMEYMNEPPKKRDEPIINDYMWREISFGGLYCILMCLWFLKSNLVLDMFESRSDIRYLTAFFALFMFTGICSGFCARTHHLNLLDHLSGNKPFLTIMAMVASVQLILIYYGGSVFRTGGLAINELVFILLLSSTAIIAHLLRKIWYERKDLPVGT